MSWMPSFSHLTKHMPAHSGKHTHVEGGARGDKRGACKSDVTRAQACERMAARTVGGLVPVLSGGHRQSSPRFLLQRARHCRARRWGCRQSRWACVCVPAVAAGQRAGGAAPRTDVFEFRVPILGGVDVGDGQLLERVLHNGGDPLGDFEVGEGLVEQAIIAHLRTVGAARRSRRRPGSHASATKRAGPAQGGATARRADESPRRRSRAANAARRTLVTIAFTSSGEKAPSSPSSSMLTACEAHVGEPASSPCKAVKAAIARRFGRAGAALRRRRRSDGAETAVRSESKQARPVSGRR